MYVEQVADDCEANLTVSEMGLYGFSLEYTMVSEQVQVEIYYGFDTNPFSSILTPVKVLEQDEIGG